MKSSTKLFTILMANDDSGFCVLMQEALSEVDLPVHFYAVHNGEKLLDYLYHRDPYADVTAFPTPDLILLDLNMPRVDGREALQRLKSDPKMRAIPIVVITTSHQEEDIFNCYQAGVNSFLVKPMTFEKLVWMMQEVCRYWFELVCLPSCSS
ncbi:response regulator [Phormidium sp. CCY1219]|uniref:response regulator n=1 Tax=Phormidium sp. CCY1219 TaxID=2886104 RepID=UPI002D1E6F5F|nr:response regulator [Phormidium sp. CCY1219]MEB3831271.1 response regulator [Phormidium sp. CCY1219]